MLRAGLGGSIPCPVRQPREFATVLRCLFLEELP